MAIAQTRAVETVVEGRWSSSMGGRRAGRFVKTWCVAGCAKRTNGEKIYPTQPWAGEAFPSQQQHLRWRQETREWGGETRNTRPCVLAIGIAGLTDANQTNR